MSLWTRFKKLFWNPPVEPDRPGIWGNTISGGKINVAFYGLPCGIVLGRPNGDESILTCGRRECRVCNPMNPERAAKINERFLKERGYVQPND